MPYEAVTTFFSPLFPCLLFILFIYLPRVMIMEWLKIAQPAPWTPSQPSV